MRKKIILISAVLIVLAALVVSLCFAFKSCNNDQEPGATSYNIVIENDGHGTAKAQVGGNDVTTAESSAEVTLIATPEDGYQFKEWVVVSGNVTVTDHKFTMPANDVTVKAVFEETNVLVQLTKVADSLYSFASGDYEAKMPAVSQTDKKVNKFFGSTIRNGNYFGSNFDSHIGDGCAFVVTTKATDTRHASIGVVNPLWESITDDMVQGGLSKDKLRELTWFTVDGINDAGLACSMSLVYTADLQSKNVNGTNPGKEEIMDLFLVRALLDHCATVEEAKTYLSDHNVTSVPDSDWDIHLMIADVTNTVIVEFTGEQEPIKYTDERIMTDFYNYLFDYNSMNFPSHSAGMERFHILNDNYNTGNSMQGMWELLKKVRYTQTYDTQTDPFWCSEYYHDIATFKDFPREYWTKNKVLAEKETANFVAAYEQYRNIGELSADVDLYHTAHNITIDLANKKVWITINEDYDVNNRYEFSFNLD